MTTEHEVQDDADTPVAEALLMGSDEDAEALEAEAQKSDAPEPEDIDPEALARIAADEEVEKTVPQARFNQVYAEKKALEEELERLRGTKAEEKPGEDKPTERATIQSLRDQEAAIEDALEAAMYEGDTAKSKDLRAELRALRGQIDDMVMSEAEVRAEKRLDGRREMEAFQTLAAALEAKYPVLNGETGDPEAIALVVELRDAYIAKGMPLTQALQMAADKIAPRFARGEAKPEGKPDDRNVTAITRGANDSNRIPPSDGGVGNRALAPADVNDISVDEWERLPQSERDKILAA